MSNISGPINGGSGGGAGAGNFTASDYANYSALPSASSYTGKDAVVLAAQGVPFLSRKAAGVYNSDGVTWNYIGPVPKEDDSTIYTDPTGRVIASASILDDALDQLDAGIRTKFTSLADVSISVSATVNGNMLFFRTADNKWHSEVPPNWITAASANSAYAPATYSFGLGYLQDVSIASNTDGYFLAWSSAAGQYTLQAPLWITSAAASVLVSSLTVNFITSASASTMIGTLTANFITSASTSTLIASFDYKTSNGVSVAISAAVVNFITSAAASALASVVAAAVVAPYLTSNSASTGYASIAHTHALDALSDVSTAATPVDGGQVTWSSARSQYIVTAAAGGSGITAFSSASDVSVASLVNGQILIYQSSDSKWHNATHIAPIGITVDGGGTAFVSGSKGFYTAVYAGSITNWYLAADVSGNVIFDVKRSGTTIIGAGNKPTLTGAISGNQSVSSWTSNGFVAGDILEFYVDSAATLTRVNLVLKVSRTS